MTLVRVAIGSAKTLYTYEWTGTQPLRVGEKVLVPVKDWESEATAVITATVAAIGSDYAGAVKKIIRRQHHWEKDR